MTFLRIAVGVLLGLLGLVIAVPAVVLIDLVSGGTGLGLCPDGLGTCTAGAYAGAELFIILSAIVAGIAFLLVVCVRLLRRISRAEGSVRLG